jgi:hypothetical protein
MDTESEWHKNEEIRPVEGRFSKLIYYFFAIRRKQKDALGNYKNDQKYVTELDQDFEAKFWEFDNRVIACV